MKLPDLTKMMKTSISEVFETAFFETVEIRPAGADISLAAFGDQRLTGAMLRFSGEEDGAVFVVIPDRWLSRMTSDFLGIDPEEVTDDQKTDTIKEATNMIAGHMFSQFDSEALIQLGIPGIISPPPPPLPKAPGSGGAMVWATTETEKMVVAIDVESSEAPVKS